MFWQVTSFPRCQYHVFLSHCAADRDDLVHRVYERLMERQIVPWLDRHDYTYGRDSRQALRDGLLKSRHVAFFVTPHMLNYSRGWCHFELAYADLLQSNLVHNGGNLVNLTLPLFFLDRNDAELPRTVWESLRDRGRFFDAADGDRVTWAVEQIAAFLRNEQDLALDLSYELVPGRALHNELAHRVGLVKRVGNFDPGTIP